MGGLPLHLKPKEGVVPDDFPKEGALSLYMYIHIYIYIYIYSHASYVHISLYLFTNLYRFLCTVSCMITYTFSNLLLFCFITMLFLFCVVFIVIGRLTTR